MSLITLDAIQSAYDKIKDQLVATPIMPALTLSRSLNCDLFLKLENLQLTGSFKARGALNKLLSLTDAEKAKGVIACSAGNHAQGVAYHAKQMGIHTTIVMPQNTPTKKVENTKQWGANIILHGDNFSEAAQQYESLSKERGLIPISAFNDPWIIAGQGTVGLEMIQDTNDLDYLIVPVGGGGLISGIATAMKSLSPQTKIIAVESESCPAVTNLLNNKTLSFDDSTIAEGIAVKEPGELTLKHIKEYVDDILVVKEDSIEDAIYRLLTQEKLVAEGAAAASLAAVLENQSLFTGKKVGLIICGGNIDQSLLAHIIMRGMMRDGLFTLIRFTTEDKTGTLAHITKALTEANASIVEIRHNRLFRNLPVKKAEIDITVETKGSHHVTEIEKILKENNLLFEVLSSS